MKSSKRQKVGKEPDTLQLSTNYSVTISQDRVSRYVRAIINGLIKSQETSESDYTFTNTVCSGMYHFTDPGDCSEICFAVPIKGIENNEYLQSPVDVKISPHQIGRLDSFINKYSKVLWSGSTFEESLDFTNVITKDNVLLGAGLLELIQAFPNMKARNASSMGKHHVRKVCLYVYHIKLDSSTNKVYGDYERYYMELFWKVEDKVGTRDEDDIFYLEELSSSLGKLGFKQGYRHASITEIKSDIKSNDGIYYSVGKVSESKRNDSFGVKDVDKGRGK